MIPALLSCSAHSLDRFTLEFRRVAILFSHLKTASTVNFVGRDVAAEKPNFSIARVPTIVVMKTRNHTRVDLRRRRLETDHQTSTSHLPGTLIDEPPTPIFEGLRPWQHFRIGHFVAR